jgi:hypothetical protein
LVMRLYRDARSTEHKKKYFFRDHISTLDLRPLTVEAHTAALLRPQENTYDTLYMELCKMEMCYPVSTCSYNIAL